MTMRNRYLLVMTVLILVAVAILATTTGELGPSSSAQESSPTTAWVNIDSVFVDDAKYASYAGTTSDSLYVTNFGFTLDTDDTIDSIWVTVNGYGGAGSPQPRRLNVGMTKDGTTRVGNGVTFQLETSDGDVVHTGSTPLWGTTFTATEINASTFGVTMYKLTTTARTDYVDYVTIRVAYTSAVGSDVVLHRADLIRRSL